MPIASYHGEETYVAYLDISGFKKLMDSSYRNGTNYAIEVLDLFYNTISTLIMKNDENPEKSEISVLMFSDSAILYCRNSPNNLEVDGLIDLLLLLKDINSSLFKSKYNILTTSSLSFGDFHYNRQDVTTNVTQSFIYGKGYVSSYLNNEQWKPKIEPGQCRISKIDLPNNMTDLIQGRGSEILTNERLDIINKITYLDYDDQNYYFIWFADDSSSLITIKNDYNEAKYIGYRKIISDQLRSGEN
ncbi:MAG: hypothetical protein GPJ54_19560 [Candidatus Heimdallarchaeota archaeon]|nr:hypothetical protein [Candidatus Heimdallarchaeota archaeon]